MQLFYTMGDYDLVAITEAPTDEIAMQLLLEIGRLGNVGPKTPKAWTAAGGRKGGREVFMGSPGDVVGVHYEQPCGWCRHCRRKRTNLCQRGRSLGFDAQGGYAEVVVARQST